ncbi:hypothetical protein [Gulosibacter hominis]|uniref:hypothetical protein n=1 Tax=Gulosibacter hominis TaxID=2770504 RepID=UPI00191B6A57|nr:hypothetical protein [Gulosibacter hominis]
METDIKRRRRGTRVDPVQVNYQISRETKLQFEAMANAAGVSKGVFFEELVAHLTATQLSDRGVPRWMPQPEPDENELPIRLSA